MRGAIPQVDKSKGCTGKMLFFMALSADSQPHFTTIANFITQMDDVIQSLFSTCCWFVAIKA